MDLPKTPSFRLDGRRALVTGAGRGIGLALAAALAEADATVTLAARTREEIETAAAAIRAADGGAEAVRLDVSDLPAVAAFFDARPAFHILVNNAGANRPMPMQEVAEADYNAVLDLNVKSAFFRRPGLRETDDREWGKGQPDPHRQPDGTRRRTKPLTLLRLQMGDRGNEQGLCA